MNKIEYIHKIQTKLQKDKRNQNNKLWKRSACFFCWLLCCSCSLLREFGWFSCFLYFYYLVVTIICYIAFQSDSFNGECLSWHSITRLYCLCHFFFYFILCYVWFCCFVFFFFCTAVACTPSHKKLSTYNGIFLDAKCMRSHTVLVMCMFNENKKSAESQYRSDWVFRFASRKIGIPHHQ